MLEDCHKQSNLKHAGFGRNFLEFDEGLVIVWRTISERCLQKTNSFYKFFRKSPPMLMHLKGKIEDVDDQLVSAGVGGYQKYPVEWKELGTSTFRLYVHY